MTLPSGGVDTFTYNGLGLRVGKTDSTGTYSYVCDGTTPGSPVLSDGHALYTPGLSENRGGTSTFYDFDRLGNLWTLDGTTKNQLGYVDYSGFGGTVATGGSVSPFGYGGGNGCQSDADAGLVLMGHRYFDPRTGRFITQDPAGDGDNWYAYAGNSPVNEIDPEGLKNSPAGTPPGDYIDDYGNPYTINQDGVRVDTSVVYIQSSSYSSPGTGSGGVFSGGFPGMFNQPYSSAETHFYAGVTQGIDFFTFGTFSKFGTAAANHSGTAGALGLFAVAMASNAVGGGEVSGAKAFAKSLSKATDVERMIKGDNIGDVKRLVDQYGGSVKNWEKMKGWMPHPEGGADVEIHWYQNMADNIGRQEPKSKLPWDHPVMQMQQ